MTIIKDRVKETSPTTGAGSMTLAGAVTGYQAFSAVCSNGNEIYYCIEGISEWEVGLGVWGTGNILARSVVLASSTGSKVDFSAGTKNVFSVFPARAIELLLPKRWRLRRGL